MKSPDWTAFPQQIARFYALASRLKRIERAGWRRCGVGAADCESVADHSFFVALLALLLPSFARDENLDPFRCIALALVHDLAESIVGDITPHDAISADEKHRREEAAMRQLAATLGDDEILTLWQEFESAQTPEAKLVREMDVIEMAWQADTYAAAGALDPASQSSFRRSAQSRISSPLGQSLLDASPSV
jgi:putative hydrolase of HD superfamily